MRQNINLFNPLFQRQESLLTTPVILLSALVVLSLSLGFSEWVRFQTNQLKQKDTLEMAKMSQVQQKVDQLRGLSNDKSKTQIYEAQLKEVESALNNHARINEILRGSDFGNTQGYSAYLVAFAKQIPEGVWLTGFSLEGSGMEISLTGRTLVPESLPLFVSHLKHEKIMQGKTFSKLEMQRPKVSEQKSASVQGKTEKAEAPYLEFELHSVESKEKENSKSEEPGAQ